jgi:hypothetical protein
MLEWDTVSWIATGIFAAALLLGVLVHPLFLYMLVAAYILRPTLYAVGVATRTADERLRAIQFRSGNAALAVLVTAIVVFAVRAELQGRPTDDYITLLCIGLAAKALMGVLMAGDARAAGFRIGIAIAFCYLLFTVLEGGPAMGMLMQGLPGLAILGAALLGRWKPLVGGSCFTVLAAAAFSVFGPAGGLTMSRALMGLLLALPLAAAAACFFRASIHHAQGDTP